jgi:hypothetical protein
MTDTTGSADLGQQLVKEGVTVADRCPLCGSWAVRHIEWLPDRPGTCQCGGPWPCPHSSL